jgi:hypothetical protein
MGAASAEDVAYHSGVPPIEQLQRVPPLLLERLERQGIFTTGLLLEVSETPTRRQTLADQIAATTNDVNDWRDEALLLNLASFGQAEQMLFTQAGIVGLSELVSLSLEQFRDRLHAAARILGAEVPDDITVEGWWEQAKTLEEE